MTLTKITTDKAPAAIGPYSQAIQAGHFVFLSGQIPLIPETMQLDDASFEQQVHRVMTNLQAVAKAAGGDLSQIVKLTIYLTDLQNFATVNTIMEQYFLTPYPARATIQVAALPKGAGIEIEGMMMLADIKQ